MNAYDPVSLLVGSEGTEITHPFGIGVSIQQGTFLTPTDVSVMPVSIQTSINDFPQGFRLLAGIAISYSNEAKLPLGLFSTYDNSNEGNRLFVARLIDQAGTKRLSVVDTVRVNGSRMVTNSPPFPGATKPGTYFFVSAPEGTSMAMLRALQNTGEAASDATISLTGNSQAFLGISAADGFAAIPVNTPASELTAVIVGTDQDGQVLGNTMSLTSGQLPGLPLPGDLPTLNSWIVDTLLNQLGIAKDELPETGASPCTALTKMDVTPTSYPNTPQGIFSVGDYFNITVTCYDPLPTDCTSAPEPDDIINLVITGYDLGVTSYFPYAVSPSSPPPPIAVGRDPQSGHKGFVTATLEGHGKVVVDHTKYCVRKHADSNGLVILDLQEVHQFAGVNPIEVSPSAPIDLALGASTTGTSPGWGGGSYPADLVDGKTAYTDTWAHGVAFSGGLYPIYGPGGIRYAQINFPKEEPFSKVVIWHHGDDHFPASSFLEVWNGASWEPLPVVSRTIGPDSDYPQVGWGARSEKLTFNSVSSNSVRYGFNNSIGQPNILGSQITHGWLYEAQVFR